LPVDYFDLTHLRRLSMWGRGLFRLAGSSEGGEEHGLFAPLAHTERPFSLGREPVTTTVLSGNDPHTLDDAAKVASQLWELPLDVDQFDSD
jgi:hypothetical protein